MIDRLLVPRSSTDVLGELTEAWTAAVRLLFDLAGLVAGPVTAATLRALSDGYDALAGLVDDPDPAVRSRGVLLLDRLAGTEAARADALTPTYRRPAGGRGERAVRAVLLSVLHARGVIAPVRAALSDSAPAPRMYAELVLAGVDGPDSPAFEAVRAMLRHESGANGRFRGARAADQGNADAWCYLAERRERNRDPAGAEALAREAAARGTTYVLYRLAELRNQAGDTAGAEQLYRRAGDQGDTLALLRLAELVERAGDSADAESVALEAASLGEPSGLRRLAELREQTGDTVSAEALTVRAADWGDSGALGRLAELRRRAGDPARADRAQRFGLTAAGEVATTLDFNPNDGPQRVRGS
jgi:hypothetical protein